MLPFPKENISWCDLFSRWRYTFALKVLIVYSGWFDS